MDKMIRVFWFSYLKYSLVVTADTFFNGIRELMIINGCYDKYLELESYFIEVMIKVDFIIDLQRNKALITEVFNKVKEFID